jgi:hypothetical protein
MKTGGVYTIFLNRSHPNYSVLDAELQVLPGYFSGEAVINSHVEVAYRRDDEGHGFMPASEAEEPMLPKELWCAPQTQKLFAMVYFASYIIITGLIMVTLFTGAVAVAMTKCVDEIEEQQKEAAKAKHRASLKREVRGEMGENGDGDSVSWYERQWNRCGRHSVQHREMLHAAFSCKDDRRATGHEKRAMIGEYAPSLICPSDPKTNMSVGSRVIIGLMSSQWKQRAIAQIKMEWAMRSLSPHSPPRKDVERSFYNRLHLRTWVTRHGSGSTIGGLCRMCDLNGQRVSCFVMMKALFAELCMICFHVKDEYIFCALINGVILAAACLAGVEIFSPGTDTESAEQDMLLVMKVL